MPEYVRSEACVRPAKTRVASCWSHFAQRQQSESALDEPRVRQRELAALEPYSLDPEQVEVEHPWPPPLAAHSAELAFHFVQPSDQRDGVDARLHAHRRIEEIGLVSPAHGGALVHVRVSSYRRELQNQLGGAGERFQRTAEVGP